MNISLPGGGVSLLLRTLGEKGRGKPRKRSSIAQKRGERKKIVLSHNKQPKRGREGFLGPDFGALVVSIARGGRNCNQEEGTQHLSASEEKKKPYCLTSVAEGRKRACARERKSIPNTPA